MKMGEINEDLQKVANSIISIVFCLLPQPVWLYDPTWKGNRAGSLAGAECMKGVVELDTILNTLSPKLQDGKFVFCSVPGPISAYGHLEPLAAIRESQGVTLILPVLVAARENFRFDHTFRQITLTVHSSLQAVGLTAAVSGKLAAKGIPANVVAGFYHDHLFVPSDRAQEALAALRELSESGTTRLHLNGSPL
jgi:uncharacterized protein